jgi:N-acetylglucosamine kinase-like BadF-type ATPase
MNERKIFLGIDGGGTKTEALIADEHGVLLGRCTAGPSNPLFSPQLTTLTSLSQVVNSVLHGYDRSQVVSAAVCVPGVESVFPKEKLAHEVDLLQTVLDISGDDFSTFFGALGKRYGIVVAAGTGSFATGIDSQGKVVQTGGWGPLLGDEGSGYAIGKDAVRAIVAAAETNGSPTLLSELILKHFQIHNYIELRSLIYRSTNYQNEISALVPFVLKAAQMKDKIAQTILSQAGIDLAALAVNTAHKLHLIGEEKHIAITGGLVHLGDYLLQPFRTTILNDLGDEYQVSLPLFNPAIGSLLVAYQQKGIQFSDELLNSLKTSYAKIRGTEGD